MVRSSATVAYSIDTETVFDTCSEPPQPSKLAAKLARRAGRDPDGDSQCYERAAPRGQADAPSAAEEQDAASRAVSKKSGYSKRSGTTAKSGVKSTKSGAGKSTASGAVSSGGKSKVSKSASSSRKAASVAPSDTTSKSKKTSSSSSSSRVVDRDVASVTSSRSRKAAYWDGGASTSPSVASSVDPSPSVKSSSRSKKKSSTSASRPSYSRTHTKETTRTQATGMSSRISGASKVSKYTYNKYNSNNNHGNDPEEQSYTSRDDDHLALVPVTRPAVDPPSSNRPNSSNSTASCTSSEDSHGNGGESGMEMVQYYGDPPSLCEGSEEGTYISGRSGTITSGSQKDQQLAVWDADEDDEDRSFDEESRSRLDTIQSGSEYSDEEHDDHDDEDRSRDEEDGTYSSDEQSGSRGSKSGSASRSTAASDAIGGGELVVAEQNGSSSSSRRSSPSAEDQQQQLVVASTSSQNPDAHALAPYQQTNATSGALVPAPGRYLASAVDNNFAMVPLDSQVFEAYDHTFVTCPEHLRFRFLYTFLKKNLDKKVMVFFSTTNSAKYHSKLLGHFHIPCLTMHSRQRKDQFIKTFLKFSDLEEGILCATDAAGRDLDVPPSVDWVIQFEPPDDPSEYILRVARISCDSDRVGRSLLFLNPGEMGFLKYYHSSAIPVSEFEIPKLADIQDNIEYHVNESDSLRRAAKDAYGSYLIAYASHGFRDVYNVHDLNKNDVAAAFGLVNLPEDEEDEDDISDHGGGALVRRSSAGAGGGGGGGGGNVGSNGMWQSAKKEKTKSWLKTEKTWPHCQVKLHPSFRPGYRPPKPSSDDEEQEE